MHLDIPTLFVTLVLVSSMAGAFLWLQYHYNREIPATLIAAQAEGCLALGYLLIALRGTISDVVSLMVANGMVFIGYALFVVSVRRFFQMPVRYSILLLALALYMAEYAWFTYVDPSFLVRVEVYLLVYAAMMFYVLALLQRKYEQLRVRTWLVASLFLGLSALASLACAALSLQSGGMHDILSKNTTNAMVVLQQLVFVVGWAFSFSLMVNQRVHDERMRADSDLVHYAEALAASNRELEQFSYAISHDLQEPLRTVSSFVQLLERRYASQMGQEAAEYIAYAVGGVHRMKALITDMLDYSRVHTGGGEMAPLALEDALDEALAGLAERLATTGAAVKAEALPQVMGHRVMLTSLLQNLIDNAIKYQPPGQAAEIRLSAKQQGEWWEIVVADNGIGIDPQYHDRIFEVFRRLHTMDSYQGTGIGLALCRRIVERHGGRIWVESRAGAGSSFHITLRGAPGKVTQRSGAG